MLPGIAVNISVQSRIIRQFTKLLKTLGKQALFFSWLGTDSIKPLKITVWNT